MSLLDEAMEDFIIMNKIKAPDGYGGIIDEYSEGETVKGAMVYDNSLQAKTAQQSGVTAVYTLTVRKEVSLDYHTVLKRVKDGLYFRLTNNADDNKTPRSAGLNMRQYSAEMFMLPT